MNETALEKFRRGALELGFPLGEQEAALFSLYAERIEEANRLFNLTGCRTLEDIFMVLLLDSLALIGSLELGGRLRLADVGSGAGIPGIPIKIMRPEIALFLVEAKHKKADFLRATASLLGLKESVVVEGRAEDLAHNPQWRERFDRLTARAVAPLRILAEYTLPLLAPGGLLLAPRGPSGGEEAGEAQKAFFLLGGAIEKMVNVTLPITGRKSTLLVVRKTGRTPECFPRKPGTPARHPL